MKKILIVTYRYPPMPSMGAVRLASFVRHLPKFGWKPYVLTVKLDRTGLTIPPDEDPDQVCRTDSYDISLGINRQFRGIRGGSITRAEVGRSRIRPLKRAIIGLYDRFVAFPDAAWPWRFLGRQEALAFALKVQPNAILSSSPPATTHLIAASLAERLNVPWVADYRDPWSETALIDLAPGARRKARKLELEIMKSAAGLVTTSQPQAQSLIALHGKPTFVVTNGFEPDEVPRERVPLDRFTILYTGMMYPGKRDPRLFFEALASCAAKGKVSPSILRVVFYGPNHDVTMGMARKAGVEAFVEYHDRVPRPMSLALQRSADILLQLEWVDERAKGFYTGKFFEYLGAGRPILAVGPKGGVVEETLRRTGCGAAVSTAGEIEQFLERAIEAYRKGVSLPYERDEAAVAEYTRERQASNLARCLSELRA